MHLVGLLQSVFDCSNLLTVARSEGHKPPPERHVRAIVSRARVQHEVRNAVIDYSRAWHVENSVGVIRLSEFGASVAINLQGSRWLVGRILRADEDHTGRIILCSPAEMVPIFFNTDLLFIREGADEGVVQNQVLELLWESRDTLVQLPRRMCIQQLTRAQFTSICFCLSKVASQNAVVQSHDSVHLDEAVSRCTLDVLQMRSRLAQSVHWDVLVLVLLERPLHNRVNVARCNLKHAKCGLRGVAGEGNHVSDGLQLAAEVFVEDGLEGDCRADRVLSTIIRA